MGEELVHYKSGPKARTQQRKDERDDKVRSRSSILDSDNEAVEDEDPHPDEHSEDPYDEDEHPDPDNDVDDGWQHQCT
ncbi:hypothetical protein CCACVL1_25485 [Corchorus capsularis]|uniref:Uncharacterized protein n=1 Tax=Corchorus capsularis TaxID=210143 RepID=A0A1R3GJQ7_COCAP|nr:hypothetical protein CCACVL1_25485 [Corchorus capsularis]